MNLTLRRCTQKGLIDPSQHDAILGEFKVPEHPRDVELEPLAGAVLELYALAGGAPISSGMAGIVDRRAEVMGPRMALARERHPEIDREFWLGCFTALDNWALKRMLREQERAMEKAKQRG